MRGILRNAVDWRRTFSRRSRPRPWTPQSADCSHTQLRAKNEKGCSNRPCENSAEFSHTAGLGLFSRPEADQKQKSREIFVRAIVRIFSATFPRPVESGGRRSRLRNTRHAQTRGNFSAASDTSGLRLEKMARQSADFACGSITGSLNVCSGSNLTHSRRPGTTPICAQLTAGHDV